MTGEQDEDRPQPREPATSETFRIVRRLALELLTASQPSQVLQVVAREVRLLLDAPASLIFLRRGREDTLRPTIWDGLAPGLREAIVAAGVEGAPPLGQPEVMQVWDAARRAMQQGSVIEARGMPPDGDSPSPHFRTVVAVPLQRRKETIGVLELLFQAPRPVGQVEVYILESSAALAAAALDNIRLLRQEREQRLQTSLLLEVAQATTSALAQPEILQQVADKAASLAQADRCSIWLLSEDGETLQPAALSGMDEAFVRQWLQHPIALADEPLSQQALEEGQPVIVQDAWTDPRTHKEAVQLFGDRSLIVFPLLGRQRRLGTLFLNWVREQKFLSEADLAIAQAVASQVAVALEYAWLHTQARAQLQETRSAFRQLRALQQTTSLLTSTLDLQERLERIAWGVVNGLGYNVAALCVLDENRTALRVSAVATAPHLRSLVEAHVDTQIQSALLPLDHTDNLAVQTALSGETRVSPHLADFVAPVLSREASEAIQESAEVGWLAAVPLTVHGECLGSLLAGAPQAQVQPSQLETLQAFASQAATAIHNAALHQQVADSERRYRDMIEHANDAILHLDEQLRLILVNRKAEGLLGQPREELLGRRVTRLVAPGDRRRLTRRAGRTLQTGTPSAPFEIALLDAQGHPIAVELSLAQVVAPDQGPSVQLIARDIRERKRLEAERTNLLAETRRKSRQLQMAFRQVGAALASMPHLDETLQAIVELARDLLEADWCTLHDCSPGPSDSGEAEGPTCLGSAIGEAPWQMDGETLAAWVEQVRSAGSPVQVAESSLHLSQEPGMGRLLGVPLILYDEPVAVLTLRRARPAPFSQEEVALVSGFAHMAALAMERARLFASVLEEKQESEAIIQHTADGIMILGPQGHILDANPALEDLLGVPREELVGQKCHDVLCGGQHQRENCPLLTHTTGQMATYSEHTLWSPGGQKVPVGVSYGPIRDDTGALIRLVAVIRDISRQREMDRLRSDFVSAVSHELRTPLALIKGYADTLLREDVDLPPETREHFLQQISASTERLERLINDLFTVSRLDAGRLELEPKVFNVGELIREVVEDMRQVTEQDIQVRLPLTPTEVRADPGRIQQVLTNLLNNAAKFSPPTSTITVTANLEGENQQIHICVEDEGPGIPPQHLTHVFDKFYRVERGMIRKAPGVGLGLYISRTIVEAHGGTIWAENRPEGGSAFHFRLPISGPDG